MQPLMQGSVVTWVSQYCARDGKLQGGIICYSGQAFDQQAVRCLIQNAYNSFSQVVDVEVISGLTNIGIPGIAYEEAFKRG